MAGDDTRPCAAWSSPAYRGDVHEFDDADGSVWKLDTDAMVWRRLTGPGVPAYIHKGVVYRWSPLAGWSYDSRE